MFRSEAARPYLREEGDAFEALGEEDENDRVHRFRIVTGAERWIEDDVDERVKGDGLEVLLVRLPARDVHEQANVSLRRPGVVRRAVVDLLKEHLSTQRASQIG